MKKTPPVFSLGIPRDGGLDSSARGNRRCRPESHHGGAPLISLDPLKECPAPPLNITCPKYGLQGEIAILFVASWFFGGSKASFFCEVHVIKAKFPGCDYRFTALPVPFLSNGSVETSLKYWLLNQPPPQKLGLNKALFKGNQWVFICLDHKAHFPANFRAMLGRSG